MCWLEGSNNDGQGRQLGTKTHCASLCKRSPAIASRKKRPGIMPVITQTSSATERRSHLQVVCVIALSHPGGVNTFQLDSRRFQLSGQCHSRARPSGTFPQTHKYVNRPWSYPGWGRFLWGFGECNDRLPCVFESDLVEKKAAGNMSSHWTPSSSSTDFEGSYS